jgi:hypothetical protein
LKTCLADYLGRRIFASSILPISKSTLIYGSADVGVTVKNSSNEMNVLVEKLAAKLNLKGHFVGPVNKPVFLHGPGDLEGHAGLDGRYYLLDFARLFPPEPPTKRCVEFITTTICFRHSSNPY